jgi:hypothetical protein
MKSFRYFVLWHKLLNCNIHNIPIFNKGQVQDVANFPAGVLQNMRLQAMQDVAYVQEYILNNEDVYPTILFIFS